MEKKVFVAREKELARLDDFLRQTLDGHGAVCFIMGEAGSGKTALITEFAQRAQDRYSKLAVAIGQSDAHTGAGDALLPFREILGQLTGDVEAKLSQGAITKENANRLRKLLVRIRAGERVFGCRGLSCSQSTCGHRVVRRDPC